MFFVKVHYLIFKLAISNLKFFNISFSLRIHVCVRVRAHTCLFLHCLNILTYITTTSRFRTSYVSSQTNTSQVKQQTYLSYKNRTRTYLQCLLLILSHKQIPLKVKKLVSYLSYLNYFER
jgi:hypothetical protein